MKRITVFVGVLSFALAGYAASPSSTATAASPQAVAVAAAKSLPLLKISANGRFFVQENGKPFFWLGDTAWGLFPHATKDDADFYLHDRAAKGFTVIQTVIALWDARSRANPEGQLPFIDRDPTKPNEEYFKNVDYVVDEAASLGLYVAILPFWTKGEGGNIPALLDPATAEWFGHYLGWRYRDKPVIWILGGDTPGNTRTGPDYTPLMRALAAGLKAGDGGKHLITYHPTGKQSSSFWFQNEPWLDFDMIQSGHFVQNMNFNLVAGDYAKTPAKPIIDGEAGYENITDGLVRNDPTAKRLSAADVRRYGYLAVFAGAAGQTYGNGEVYEFWEPGRAVLPAWAAGLPWRESLQLPGAGQMQYLRKLIESRPMLVRIPDQNLIVGDANANLLDANGNPVESTDSAATTKAIQVKATTERIEATRASDGSYALIYTAAGRPITARLSLLAGDTIRAFWYDPRTGSSTLIGETPKTDTQTFTPPDSGKGNDWVLVLDNAAAHFVPPGSARAVEN
jgi:hypothetical protein